MPIHEFVCKKCKKEFEIVRSVSEYDSSKIECPECHSSNVQVHWSHVSVVTSKKS